MTICTALSRKRRWKKKVVTVMWNQTPMATNEISIIKQYVVSKYIFSLN